MRPRLPENVVPVAATVEPRRSRIGRADFCRVPRTGLAIPGTYVVSAGCRDQHKHQGIHPHRRGSHARLGGRRVLLEMINAPALLGNERTSRTTGRRATRTEKDWEFLEPGRERKQSRAERSERVFESRGISVLLAATADAAVDIIDWTLLCLCRARTAMRRYRPLSFSPRWFPCTDH